MNTNFILQHSPTSWSKDWGENGFLRLERNRNLCGVAGLPKFPVLQNSNLKEIRPIQLDNSLCQDIKDIFSTSNVYIKSICVSNFLETNYIKARDLGFEKGMRLYKSDSSQVDKTVFDHLKSRFMNVYHSFFIETEAGGCKSIEYDYMSQSYTLYNGACSVRKYFLFEYLNIRCEF